MHYIKFILKMNIKTFYFILTKMFKIRIFGMKCEYSLIKINFEISVIYLVFICYIAIFKRITCDVIGIKSQTGERTQRDEKKHSGNITNQSTANKTLTFQLSELISRMSLHSNYYSTWMYILDVVQLNYLHGARMEV